MAFPRKAAYTSFGLLIDSNGFYDTPKISVLTFDLGISFYLMVLFIPRWVSGTVRF